MKAITGVVYKLRKKVPEGEGEAAAKLLREELSEEWLDRTMGGGRGESGFREWRKVLEAQLLLLLGRGGWTAWVVAWGMRMAWEWQLAVTAWLSPF